jgi:hypothetical protein
MGVSRRQPESSAQSFGVCAREPSLVFWQYCVHGSRVFHVLYVLETVYSSSGSRSRGIGCVFEWKQGFDRGAGEEAEWGALDGVCLLCRGALRHRWRRAGALWKDWTSFNCIIFLALGWTSCTRYLGLENELRNLVHNCLEK